MKFDKQIGTYTGSFLRKYINAENDEEVPPKEGLHSRFFDPYE